LLDINTFVFVFSIVVVGLLLTVNIRRDFIHKQERLRRDLQRQDVRTRRRPAARP
jgi:hypothetical protein